MSLSSPERIPIKQHIREGVRLVVLDLQLDLLQLVLQPALLLHQLHREVVLIIGIFVFYIICITFIIVNIDFDLSVQLLLPLVLLLCLRVVCLVVSRLGWQLASMMKMMMRMMTMMLRMLIKLMVMRRVMAFGMMRMKKKKKVATSMAITFLSIILTLFSSSMFVHSRAHDLYFDLKHNHHPPT